MTTSLLSRVALPALAAAALAAPLDAQRVERFTLTGRRVAVHNLAGEVTVAAGPGSAVVVEVTRGGQDAPRLRVDGGGDALRVVYPGDRVVYPRMGAGSSTTLQVRRDGSLGSALVGNRRVTVVGSGAGTCAYADVRVLVPAGRTVAVHHGVGRVQVTGVNGRVEVTAHSASVRTQGTRGGLEVNLGAGSVDVRDAQGDVQVGSGSGAVTLGNVRGSTLDVGVGSGTVTGSGVRVQTLDVGTGSGRVALSGVSARDVTVETGSGAVELGLVSDVNELEIATGSGGVTVTVPAGFGARLEVEARGGISVDLPLSDRRIGRGTLAARMGDGNGRVVIATGSGAVRIRRG